NNRRAAAPNVHRLSRWRSWYPLGAQAVGNSLQHRSFLEFYTEFTKPPLTSLFPQMPKKFTVPSRLCLSHFHSLRRYISTAWKDCRSHGMIGVASARRTRSRFMIAATMAAAACLGALALDCAAAQTPSDYGYLLTASDRSDAD